MTGVAAAVAAGPEAKWMSTRYNFGAFAEEGGPVSCEFKVVNTGDSPLNILSAKASCGCTTPAYTLEPIAPGDTAAIVVAYNPEGRPGRFNKNVLIETDATNEPKIRLAVQGVVIGAYESVAAHYPIDHGALKFRVPAMAFGRMANTKLKTVYIDAYNRSNDSIRPRVESKPRYFDLTFEPKTVGPGEQLTLIGYLRAGEANTWGLLEDSITIAAGNDRFALPITAIINEDFSSLTADRRDNAPVAVISGETVDLGRIDTNDLIERTVELTNRGKTPLEVRRVYSTDKDIDVTIDHTTIGKGKSAIITIIIDPAKSGDEMVNSRVTVMTNDPQRSEITLRVIGEKVTL